MRNINPAALQRIAEREGSDPLILVQIYWDEQVSIIYGDRGIATDGIRGCLLSVGNIDNVINTSQGSNTGSISIQMDDTSGELKRIYDEHDIHKRPVYVLQWFPELPLKDAFIIFDGVISSPIIWNEGDRTLSFEVVSQVEDLEVGYSAEEGNFTYIPQNVIGQAWPLIFGSVLQIPAIQINESPEGNSLQDTGFNADVSGSGNTTPNYMSGVRNEQELSKAELYQMAIYSLTVAQGFKDAADEYSIATYGTSVAFTANFLTKGTYHVPVVVSGNYTTLDYTISSNNNTHVDSATAPAGSYYTIPYSYSSMGDVADSTLDSLISQDEEWLKKAGEYLTLYIYGYPYSGGGGNNQTAEDAQKVEDLQKNQLTIHGGNKFPQKTNTIITIDGAKFEGYFEGEVFHIKGRTHPFTDSSSTAGPTTIIDRALYTTHVTDMKTGTFFYAIAGSTAKLASDNYPIYYIVGIGHLTNVVAYGKIKGKTRQVPRAYYTVTHKTFGTLKSTILTMKRPLSTREGWDGDEIWCSSKSPIGPNGIDILEYLIENYTNGVIDEESFAFVRPFLAPYGCNFAVTERKNCLNLIKEIAYQLRCAVWYKGGKFYIKYLPLKYTPVDTITEDDVEAGTLVINSTDTEEIVTKWTVKWRQNGSQEKDYSIIYRYHILKYGMVESEYTAFCFNTQKSVEKFALFWLIRQANTWKKISFSTFLTKLNLEPFDSVLIDFNRDWVNDPGCVTPTIGIVEQASYNSETKQIDLVIWLPIRLGEKCPYEYAYPSGLNTTYIFPPPKDTGGGGGGGKSADTGVPGEKATGDLYNQAIEKGIGVEKTTDNNSGSGGNKPVGDSNDQTPEGKGEFNPPVELDPESMVNRGSPNVNNQIVQNVLKPMKKPDPYVKEGVFPGKVMSKIEKNIYLVNTYTRGLENTPLPIKVTQLQINENDTIPTGTWVFVNRCSILSKSGLEIPEHTMQAPVWIRLPTEGATPAPKSPDVPASDGGQTAEPPVEPPPQTDEGDEEL